MNARQLISHHLFVAAVKETDCARREPERRMVPVRASEASVWEVPVELLDFERRQPRDAYPPVAPGRRAGPY